MSNCNNNTNIGDTVKLVSDIKRDAGLLHEVVHSNEDEMMVDTGPRKTLKGLTAYLKQVIAENGYKPPVEYLAGLSISEPHFTVIHDGIVYAPRPDLLPFETTDPFNPDQWLTLQGLTSIRLGMEDGATLVGYGNRTTAERLREFKFFEDYGAKGNGIDDDTDAIELAIIDSAYYGHGLIGHNRYKLTRSVNFRSIKLNAEKARWFLTDGAQIILGGKSGNSDNPDQSIGMVTQKSVVMDPSTYTHPSIIVMGAKNQYIRFRYVDYLLFYLSTDPTTFPNDASIAYCTFDIGFGVKIEVDTDPRYANGEGRDGPGTANQWFNENKLNINRCFGIEFKGSYRHNNNFINGGSFEGDKSYIKVTSGNKNHFTVRLEGDPPVIFSKNTEGNTFTKSYFGSTGSMVIMPSIIDHGVMNRISTSMINLSNATRIVSISPMTRRMNNRLSPFHHLMVCKRLVAKVPYGLLFESEFFEVTGNSDVIIFDLDGIDSSYQIRVYVKDSKGRSVVNLDGLSIDSGFLKPNNNNNRLEGGIRSGFGYGQHRLMIKNKGVYFVAIQLAASADLTKMNSYNFVADIYSNKRSPRATPTLSPATKTCRILPTEYIGYAGDIINSQLGSYQVTFYSESTVSSIGFDYIVVKRADSQYGAPTSGDIIGIESESNIIWAKIVSVDSVRLNLDINIPSWVSPGNDVYVSRMHALKG